ncbi:MAG: ATP-binding cassette domain-containing protein [Aerococcus sanguinicola]
MSARGAIRINGTDIRQVPRDNLRQHFGMVLQDTWLLQASIEENIRYGKSGASQEEVIQAAKQAYCYHFIESLPDGFDTLLNEEASNISQGQRQLLTIARAFISDPDILILDEATSSVDTRTEGLIQEAMANLMTGRTNFVIAHRLSTIVDADHILVLDQGDIVEQGSHQELLALNGTYAKLYQSQFAE